MADMNAMLAKPSLVATHDPASNTNAVVTIAAPATGQCIYLCGVIFSADGAPTAAVKATVAGPAVAISARIPASAFAPIVLFFGNRPVRCAEATAAVITLPALGVGVTGSVSVMYFLGTS